MKYSCSARTTSMSIILSVRVTKPMIILTKMEQILPQLDPCIWTEVCSGWAQAFERSDWLIRILWIAWKWQMNTIHNGAALFAICNLLVLPPCWGILTYISSHPSEINNKDFIWNFQKSQKRSVFVKVFSGYRPFSMKPLKVKPRSNELNISLNFAKLCSVQQSWVRLTTLLNLVQSCCFLLSEVYRGYVE